MSITSEFSEWLSDWDDLTPSDVVEYLNERNLRIEPVGRSDALVVERVPCYVCNGSGERKHKRQGRNFEYTSYLCPSCSGDGMVWPGHIVDLFARAISEAVAVVGGMSDRDVPISAAPLVGIGALAESVLAALLADAPTAWWCTAQDCLWREEEAMMGACHHDEECFKVALLRVDEEEAP